MLAPACGLSFGEMGKLVFWEVRMILPDPVLKLGIFSYVPRCLKNVHTEPS